MERISTPEAILIFKKMYPMTHEKCVNKIMKQKECEQFIILFILSKGIPTCPK
jgi:hypothetical protein